jgi:NAD(P)-dependent dehydrogenase (short-subunit alcohol dehydrogenase family)
MPSKTVFITGATGLLGRQVARAFQETGWNVKGTGYSRADGASILRADLSKPSEVGAALNNIKFVNHLYPRYRTACGGKLTGHCQA